MAREAPANLCPACGTPCRPSARFCAVCGAPFDSTPDLPGLVEPGSPPDDAPLPVVEIQGIAYLGGLFDLAAELRTVSLIIGEDGVGIYRRRRELLLIDDDDVLALRVFQRGPDTVFEIHTHRGVGHFEGLIDAWDLSLLEPYLLRRPTAPPSAEPAPPAAPPGHAPAAAPWPAARRARLEELRILHEDGLIPTDEYQRRCAEIIAEI